MRDHDTHHERLAGAVYNSPNREMSPSSRLRWVWCALMLVSRLSFAADWRQMDAQMAQKIAATTGPGVIALQVSNRSSIVPSDVEEIRRDLAASLATSGVRVWQADQAATAVEVTLSENLQNYVWAAEIRQGASDARLLLISAPRPEATIAAQNAPPVVIHVTPLISRREPILDAAVIENNARTLLVLGVNDVSVLGFKEGHWLPGSHLTISHGRPLPRDARGRVISRKDHLFDAYLPGLICRSTNSNPPGMDCASSDDPWPLQTPEFGLSAFFSPARNFFTGAIVPGIGKQRSAPPFYSAAAVPRSTYTMWILSGVDGDLRLMDGINQQTLAKVRWGSGLAGVRAACRPGWQVLSTLSDGDSEDSVQAFEFPDREPVAVSQKLNLKGMVTALWTATDGMSATAIYRNSETGNYEAVQLTLACSQ